MIMEEEALDFARKAHGKQQRKYTLEPYINHPKRVAEIVRTVPHSTEMICAAYLHDVVEDTPVSVEEIEKRFGKKTAHLVWELTDEFTHEKYPHLNRKKRKKKEVERQATMSVEAKTIKLADVIDNTPDITRNDLNFARRYVPEMKALTAILTEGDPELLQRARKEIERAENRIAKSKFEKGSID